MWLWFRALVYMLIIGSGWLIVLPALCLYSEHQSVRLHFNSSHILVWTGVALVTMGVTLALWAGYHLIRHGQGTPFPLDPTIQLVTSGPYHHIRNPQAVAMLLLSAGVACIIESRWLWLLVPLTIIYLECLVGPMEERQLASKFGQQYLKYQSQVRKWIPRWH